MTAANTLLVMFDVDGTLTESLALDAETFLDAVRATFGFADVSNDWASYRHVTSVGVLQEIVEARLSRIQTDEESMRMQSCFRELLLPRIKAAGGVRPVPGGAAVIAHLAATSQEYAVALASGNWAATARDMLGSAGLSVTGVPGAFSDDDPTREGICRLAQRRAEEQHGRTFPRVIYVGDGVWDVRTARMLGYGFVGIGRGAAKAKLHAAGATEVLPDFKDTNAFLAAVGREVAKLPPASFRSAGRAELAC